MKILGFKLRHIYRCFVLKYATLLMVLIPCSWTQDNIPSFNVTCDSSGLYVKIAFSKPFNGIVYAKGHRFDPLCIMTESSVLDGSLALPLTACGTFVQETDHPWITNTLAIQQHPLIKSVNDLEKTIICLVSQPFENFWDSALLLDQIYESHSLPLTKSSSDFQLGSGFFHENSATIFGSSFTRLNIFQLLNGTIYNDVGIKSCIAHNTDILAENASVQHITNPEGCFTSDSMNSSLVIIRTDKGLMAYVEMQNLEMKSSDSFYLTCEVILCKTKCKCSEIEQQTEHLASVISHKLTKRSTDTSEMFSSKQYEARTRYLKSTVKALMGRIMEQRKQNDKSKIRKRLLRLDDSSESQAVISSEIVSTEPVSTEFYNIQPHLVDIYDKFDTDDSHRDFDTNRAHRDFDTNDSHRDFDTNDSHRDFDTTDSHRDIDINDSHQDFDLDDSHQDFDPDDSHQDFDPDDSHQNYSEDISLTKEFSTADSNVVVVTLPKESEVNGTEIVSEEFQGKGTRVLNDGAVLPENEATENIKIVPSSILPPTIEIVNDHLGSCVPRMRFIIVIIVMGFFIGTLLLVSCGMALYIRKEKKRNKLNDFLLYSIGF